MQTNWHKIDDDTPQDREIMLWLGVPEGESEPIGPVIGRYVDTDFFLGWAEKSVAGNINTGLPQELVKYWKELSYDELKGMDG